MWAELRVGVQGGQGLLVHLLLTHNSDPAALATLSVGKLGQGVLLEATLRYRTTPF